MNLKHKFLIASLVLFVAWIFDQLFWQKIPGISVPLFVIVYLAGLFTITRLEGQRPAIKSLWLLGPILVFSVLSMWRLEPFTSFVNLLMLIVNLILLTLTWMGGNWLRYSLSDLVVRLATLSGLGLIGPLQVFLMDKNDSESAADGEEAETTAKGPSKRRWLGSILLGLVMAAPIVAILGVLLSAADPVFEKQMVEFLKYFSIEYIKEYFVRAFLILILGYLLLGAVLFSLLHSRDEKLIGLEKPWLPPFLNWISSSIVLLSINILFLTFVIVQFQYFFGGQANISYAGFTYSEYARRGFGELICAAFISMLIFLVLGFVTRRTDGLKRHLYSVLGIFLVTLVGVMLVSAFQRLTLYETVYGFSRLRVYTSIFLIWLGILLAVTAVLELSNHLRAFSMATLFVCCGFGITLSALNVDGFITRSNAAAASAEHKLDAGYLTTLSKDSVPDLFDIYRNPGTPPEIKQQAGFVLLCQQVKADPEAWPSFHLSNFQAGLLLTQYGADLSHSSTTYREKGIWHVQVNGEYEHCDDGRRYMD